MVYKPYILKVSVETSKYIVSPIWLKYNVKGSDIRGPILYFAVW